MFQIYTRKRAGVYHISDMNISLLKARLFLDKPFKGPAALKHVDLKNFEKKTRKYQTLVLGNSIATNNLIQTISQMDFFFESLIFREGFSFSGILIKLESMKINCRNILFFYNKQLLQTILDIITNTNNYYINNVSCLLKTYNADIISEINILIQKQRFKPSFEILHENKLEYKYIKSFRELSINACDIFKSVGVNRVSISSVFDKRFMQEFENQHLKLKFILEKQTVAKLLRTLLNDYSSHMSNNLKVSITLETHLPSCESKVFNQFFKFLTFSTSSMVDLNWVIENSHHKSYKADVENILLGFYFNRHKIPNIRISTSLRIYQETEPYKLLKLLWLHMGISKKVDKSIDNFSVSLNSSVHRDGNNLEWHKRFLDEEWFSTFLKFVAHSGYFFYRDILKTTYVRRTTVSQPPQIQQKLRSQRNKFIDVCDLILL